MYLHADSVPSLKKVNVIRFDDGEYRLALILVCLCFHVAAGIPVFLLIPMSSG
jgi:hypothetical protein